MGLLAMVRWCVADLAHGGAGGKTSSNHGHGVCPSNWGVSGVGVMLQVEAAVASAHGGGHGCSCGPPFGRSCEVITMGTIVELHRVSTTSSGTWSSSCRDRIVPVDDAQILQFKEKESTLQYEVRNPQWQATKTTCSTALLQKEKGKEKQTKNKLEVALFHVQAGRMNTERINARKRLV